MHSVCSTKLCRSVETRLTVEDALLVTGSIGEDIFYQLAEALLGKDAGCSTYRCLINLLRKGKMFPGLAEDLITFFRDLTSSYEQHRI